MAGKRTLPFSQTNAKRRRKCPPGPTTHSSSSKLPRLIFPDSNDPNFGRRSIGDDSWCVGSSHGWLMLLDKEAKPFLVNPFSHAPRVELPPIETLPCKTQVDMSYFIEHLRKTYITKAVVFGDPNPDNIYGVAVLYGCSSWLAFCKNGDCRWKALPGAPEASSYDILVRGKLMYVLTKNLGIQTWDLSGSLPVKKREVRLSIPREIQEDNGMSRVLFGRKFYLAKSAGNLLLVLRYRGYLVNGEGVAVEEADLLSDEDTHPLLCPYRTSMFYVYKLDYGERKWVEVESLDDRALFLGGNNSFSLSAKGLSGYQGNSIYYTDDNWDQMNEDYLYGGHDFGKFNLQEKKVEPLMELDSDRVDPPPFWIVTNHTTT